MVDEKMNDEELRDRLNKCKGIVEKYIPNSVEDNYFLRSVSPSPLDRFRAVYLEVLVDLGGNEDDFKRCLNLAEAPTTNLHNYQRSIDGVLAEIKAYAYMIKNSK